MNLSHKLETFAFMASGILAIYSCLVLMLIAVLGPLGLSIIPYRTSAYMLLHVIAQDMVNACLAAPLCLVSGILLLKRKPAAAKWLIVPGLYILYTGLAYGIGNEWSNYQYGTTGSSPGQYAWLFLSLITGGLYLSAAGLQLLKQQTVPVFTGKQRWILILPSAVCLLLFTGLWIADINRVVTRGEALLAAGYAENPTAFWLIKYLDLGIILPSGFFALGLFAVKPQRAYPLLLLLFGFFALILTATVLAQIINHAFFEYYTLVLILLTLLSYAGYLFLAGRSSRRLPVIPGNGGYSHAALPAGSRNDAAFPGQRLRNRM